MLSLLDHFLFQWHLIWIVPLFVLPPPPPPPPPIYVFPDELSRKLRSLYLSLGAILDPYPFSLVRRSSYSVAREPCPKPVALSDWPRFILQDDMLLRGERVDVIICSFYDRVIRRLVSRRGLSSLSLVPFFNSCWTCAILSIDATVTNNTVFNNIVFILFNINLYIYIYRTAFDFKKVFIILELVVLWSV